MLHRVGLRVDVRFQLAEELPESCVLDTEFVDLLQQLFVAVGVRDGSVNQRWTVRVTGLADAAFPAGVVNAELRTASVNPAAI